MAWLKKTKRIGFKRYELAAVADTYLTAKRWCKKIKNQCGECKIRKLKLGPKHYPESKLQWQLWKPIECKIKK